MSEGKSREELAQIEQWKSLIRHHLTQKKIRAAEIEPDQIEQDNIIQTNSKEISRRFSELVDLVGKSDAEKILGELTNEVDSTII